jgi:hypothetical protein
MTQPKQKYWHAYTNAPTCVEDGYFVHIIIGDITGGADDVITRSGDTAREHTIRWTGLGEAMATTLVYTRTFDHDPIEREIEGLKPEDWEDAEADWEEG